jgi:hypothetical protein
LHRIWKEDIGPVSKEHRDEIWNQFSDLTKKMHDKREVLFEKLRGTELERRNKKLLLQLPFSHCKVNAHSNGLHKLKKWKP